MIKIGIDTVTNDTAHYYSSLSNEQDRKSRLQFRQGSAFGRSHKSQLKVTDLKVLEALLKQTRMANLPNEICDDADKRVQYKWIEDLTNVMRLSNATVFNFVTDRPS